MGTKLGYVPSWKEIAEVTGIDYRYLRSLRKDSIKAANGTAFDVLCLYFGVGPGELFVIEPTTMPMTPKRGGKRAKAIVEVS